MGQMNSWRWQINEDGVFVTPPLIAMAVKGLKDDELGFLLGFFAAKDRPHIVAVLSGEMERRRSRGYWFAVANTESDTPFVELSDPMQLAIAGLGEFWDA